MCTSPTLNYHVSFTQNVREGLSKVQGITTLGNPLLGTSADIDTSSSPPLGCPGSISAHDPLRFTVCVTGLGMSGFQAAEMLERDYHIVPEMATQSVGADLHYLP